jgi:hypothetical protein
VTLCTLVDRYQRFGGICYLHLHGNPEGSSEVFDNIYQTTRRYVLEECHFRNHRLDKIKFLLDEVDFGCLMSLLQLRNLYTAKCENML